MVNLALHCDASAPGRARDALRDLPELGAAREDALLVVSELVTNAVRHSGCKPLETIVLNTRVTDRCVRIAVHDPGRSADTPEARREPAGPDGGLGLRLVEEVSDRWGVERPDGRWVWAELAL